MRKWYGTRLLPALLLFCLNTAFTQNAAEERQNVRLLSLEDAVASALENNSGIKNAKSVVAADKIYEIRLKEEGE